MTISRIHRPASIRLTNGGSPYGRPPLRGAIADPFNQSKVPSPRAAGIAYPQPIDGDSPMRRERNSLGRPLDEGALEGQIAPPSQVERYPIIIGRNLTLETVSSRFRLCLTGYRQLYVDILDELIERDPHCYAVVNKRATKVGNATYTVSPPELPDEQGEKPAVQRTQAKGRNSHRTPKKKTGARQDKAKQIADECQQDFERIPRLKQHLSALAWADYWGLGGAEMIWAQDKFSKRWRPTDIVFMHSRRLSYPDPWNWDLYVWDQGAVLGSPFGDVKLPPGIFGWRVADYPGKFIVHAPQVRANYPTREGLGRELAYWMVLKHIAMRAAPEYLERFSNPPTDISYATGKEDGLHRMASDKDIADALAALRSGVMRGWLHPDSTKWELKSPDGVGGRAKVTFTEWAKYCDDQMTKAVLGGTLGTDVASSGSRALGGEQRKDTLDIMQFSAETLADSLDASFVSTWCELNYPEDEELWPHIAASVEDDPDPLMLAQRAVLVAGAGAPVDADALCEEIGVPLVDVDDPDARVMRPVKPTEPTAAPFAPLTYDNNPDAAAEREAQAQEQEQAAGEQEHQRALELTKAKTPAQVAAEAAATPGKAPGAPPTRSAAPQATPPAAKPAAPPAVSKPPGKPPTTKE